MRNQTDKNGNLYLASASAGKAWKLYAYKPDIKGREPYAVAIECAVTLDAEGTVTGTQTIHGGPESSRRLQTPIVGGRMTAKAKLAALCELERQLDAAGCLLRWTA